MPDRDWNSAKSNTSLVSIKGDSLENKISKLNGVKKAKTANGADGSDNLLKLNKNNRQAPKAGLQRMLMNRLVNANAIPGFSPGIGIPPSSNPAPTPATTSVVELLTQGGLVLTTQAGNDLIAQQGN
tara:strand:+ start:92 stop:472 length:381 start_codon:yes stop_codon:yes gene_type:complete